MKFNAKQKYWEGVLLEQIDIRTQTVTPGHTGQHNKFT